MGIGVAAPAAAPRAMRPLAPSSARAVAWRTNSRIASQIAPEVMRQISARAPRCCCARAVCAEVVGVGYVRCYGRCVAALQGLPNTCCLAGIRFGRRPGFKLARLLRVERAQVYRATADFLRHKPHLNFQPRRINITPSTNSTARLIRFERITDLSSTMEIPRTSATPR